jgi:hypothetical protein
MLTYELDSFVFRDELNYWCSKKLDYIGAPWYDGYVDVKENASIIGVGNSGFSLRNIQACRNVLEKLSQKPFNSVKVFYQDRWHHLLPSLLRGIEYGWFSALIGYPRHEDVFWCDLIPKIEPSFKIATVEEAIRFSFEVNPEILYANAGNRLPFGCHAWSKYSPKFWEDHIMKNV